MSDFIREVDEDYRRERILGFFTRFQVPLAILVIAIVAGAGGWRWWVDHKLAAAEADNAHYVAAEDLAKDGKAAAAQEAFAAIAQGGPAGYARLARMRAAELLAPRDPEAAAKAFDAIANDEAIDGSLRDAARLRGAMLRVDTEAPAAFEQRYGRFSSPGAGFHASMSELLALAALKRNDVKAAGTYFDAILGDPVAPPALRNRAQAFRALVDGGATTAMTAAPPPAKVTSIAGAAAATPSASAGPGPTTPNSGNAPPPGSSGTSRGPAPARAPAGRN